MELCHKFDIFIKKWYNQNDRLKEGFMNKVNNTSMSYRKVIAISVIFLLILGISVIAGNVKINSVKIRYSNNHETIVPTSKTKVSEILEENHIMLSSDETVIPSLDEEITDTKTIIITKTGEEPTKIAKITEEELNNDIENIAKNYSDITEEIITVQEEIPYKTITKDVSNDSKKTVNTVVQEGINGIKEVTYKVKYKNEKEIERIKISEKTIKEPIDKIVEVRKSIIVTSRSGGRVTGGSVAEYQAYAAQRCDAYGWSQTDFNCLVSLWNRESGWNPNSYNRSSGAYGIPQALPGSKMASAGADYRTNYKTQINWGLGYIKSRYSTPQRAWYHFQTTGWY